MGKIVFMDEPHDLDVEFDTEEYHEELLKEAVSGGYLDSSELGDLCELMEYDDYIVEGVLSAIIKAKEYGRETAAPKISVQTPVCAVVLVNTGHL